MKKIKKGFALLLVFVMAVSVIPQSVFAAKKKVKLSKKAVTVAVGESVKIQLKNNKKKVKWSITSGKKNVTLSKKKKTGVIIKGKKAGKTKVQAKIGKKKYVCKVTVKKAATADNENPNNGKTTAEPTQVPSQAPTVSQQPVPPVITPGVTPSEPTASSPQTPSPSVEPTPTASQQPVPPVATQTANPSETLLPSVEPTAEPTSDPSQTTEPTIKPENHYQGLYAESEPFVISSVTFDKEITSYSLAYTNIYVNQEGAASLKEVVPDVSKCTFTVYCYGKKAEVKRISDIVWNEEEGEDPYYSFALTVEQDGKEYTETVKMRLGVPKYPNNPGDLSNGLTLLSLQADDKTYELERNVAYGGETYYFKNTIKI